VRSRAEVLLVSIAIALATLVAPAPARADQDHARPDDGEIARALEAVKADPNLAPQQTIRTLAWKEADEPTRSESPGWLRWVAEFFGWIAQSARVLVWIAAIALAGLLGVYIVRFMRAYGGAAPGAEFVAPTHVRDLDIRPESLPDDIGGAARAMWDRGEHRAAMALLYRGMLSRFAHVHRVPIRDSSTEGDCLALADRHLVEPPRRYAHQLVGVWQRFVYAGEDIESATVHHLCHEFRGALDTGAAQVATQGGAV
jgi:hypothetical protein